MTPGNLLPADLGDGIVLDAARAADAEETFAVIDAERNRLREWLPWVDSTTTVEIERGFLAVIEAANAQGSGLHALIRRNGQIAGMIGLRISVLPQSAEIGYWLSAGAQGRGVMTRAVAAMVDRAFTGLGLHRIELYAAVCNTRSRAIAERLGFATEGVRREAEELANGFVDLAAYAMLSTEWPGSAAALTRGQTDEVVS